MSNCYVVQFDVARVEILKSTLLNCGFELKNAPYTLLQGKKNGITCTLYTSGKLTVQGKGMKEFIEYYLEPEVLGTFSLGYEHLNLDLTPRIGVDESGKGDFFGPLCVAGVYAGAGDVEKLHALGVKDSKTLTEATILKLAEKIRKGFAHHIVKINPEKYNELYEQFGNLNLLLGWGHATVIEQLVEKTSCEKVIIDQFAAEHVVEQALRRKKKKVALTQRTKAEADPVVAAASILARATFVEGLKILEKKVGHPLPKGASEATLKAGEKLALNCGAEILKIVGKLHFKTYTLILQRLQ